MTLPIEYDCARCGTRVLLFAAVPHDGLCPGCSFIERIPDPEYRRQVAAFIDARNPAMQRRKSPDAG